MPSPPPRRPPPRPEPHPPDHPAIPTAAAWDAGAWERDGFLCLGPIVATALLAELRAEADALVDRAVARARYPSREHATRIVQQWPIEGAAWAPWERALAPLAGVLRAALGGPGRRMTASIIAKPPRHGLTVPWHQDADSREAEGLAGITLWLALDDVGPDSGGVRYIPGSHTSGRSPPLEHPDAVIPRLAAGEALLHHAAVWHETRANRGDRWRRGLVVSWAPAARPTRGGRPWDEVRHPLSWA